MSEPMPRVSLDELATVRVLCRGQRAKGVPCGAVFEMDLARLAVAFQAAMRKWTCPFCGQPFHLYDAGGDPRDPFTPLADAVAHLLAVADRVGVEFVLPGRTERDHP